MRCILIALLWGFLLAVLCACSSGISEHHTGGTDISGNSSQFADEAEEDGEADAAGPDGCSYHDPYVFYSEEELCTVIRAGECDDEALVSLTEYYRPKQLASDLVLSEIYVKEAYVMLRYDFSTVTAPEGDRDVYYLFEWYRKMKPQSLQDELLRVFSPGAVKQIEELYYIEAGELQDVFWEREGNVFHAVTPAGISSSQLRAFCETEMVPIRRQEQ